MPRKSEPNRARTPLRSGLGELASRGHLGGGGQLEVRAGAALGDAELADALAQGGQLGGGGAVGRGGQAVGLGLQALPRPGDLLRGRCGCARRGRCARPRWRSARRRGAVSSVAVISMMLASGVAWAESLPSSEERSSPGSRCGRRVQGRGRGDQRGQRGQLALERGGVGVPDARLDVEHDRRLALVGLGQDQRGGHDGARDDHHEAEDQPLAAPDRGQVAADVGAFLAARGRWCGLLGERAHVRVARHTGCSAGCIVVLTVGRGATRGLGHASRGS